MTRPTNLKPAFNLRPLATLIKPGVVLYLQRDPAAQYLCAGTGLSWGALGHPCVVISPPQDSDLVKIALLTTFSNTRLEDHMKEAYWQDYLPIEPTACQPTYPGVRLRLNGAPVNAGGYVNFAEFYWVPWQMLTKWVSNQAFDHVRFDDASTQLILDFMGWAAGDNPLVALCDFHQVSFLRTEAYGRRLNRRPHMNGQARDRKIEVPRYKILKRPVRDQGTPNDHSAPSINSTQVLGMTEDRHTIYLEPYDPDTLSLGDPSEVESQTGSWEVCPENGPISAEERMEEQLIARQVLNRALLGCIGLPCALFLSLCTQGQ